MVCAMNSGRPLPGSRLPEDTDDLVTIDTSTVSGAVRPTPAPGPTAPRCRNAAVRPLRVGCLGDSLTELTLGGGEAYPTLLQRLLNDTGLEGVAVENFGHSG
eukprot:EG_transcript_65079